jgi:ribonuclease HII
MIVVGVDENGLGPRLGPMVVTAVTLRCRSYNAEKVRTKSKRAGIDDSKQSGGFGRMATCESLALALVERVSNVRARNADEFFSAVSLGGMMDLRAPCPRESAPQCWGENLPLPAFGGDLAEGNRMLDELAEIGLRAERVRSEILCARVLNAEFDKDISKLAIDLGAFERLLIDARRAVPGTIDALCGMVGGMRKYTEHFRHFAAGDVTVLAEERGFAAYSVKGIGRVRFEVDADGLHTPVAVASMVGKYVRELAMERQNRFYAKHDAALPSPSGYHDPVTARFVAESEPLRRRLRIDDACFERVR